jgi:hypothetical protein
MTRGQIAQLQDLSKCYFAFRDFGWSSWLLSSPDFYRFSKWEAKNLRRLTHQYAGQIRAVKRNQERA